MDLFSCRNCIHNPAQGLTVGRGAGFCLQWGSLIERPEQTTCKYLHRKDLPAFLVRRATEEHADELSATRGMVDLHTHAPVAARGYDAGSSSLLDPANHVVASYHALDSGRDMTIERRGELIALFAGCVDGRWALLHASLVRRGMLGAVASQTRTTLVLALLEEVDSDVFFDERDLVAADGSPGDAARAAARWEVAYARLSGIQEFAWHAGDERLKHPLRELGDVVAGEDWPGLIRALAKLKEGWIDAVIAVNRRPAQSHQAKDQAADIVVIPVVGRIAAGMPLVTEEPFLDTVHIERSMVGGGRDVFGLRVSGDSMIEAGIFSGDYIFVHKHSAAQPGDIVVALIGDEATVKYFFPEKDYIRFQPANATMAPILVRASDFRPTMLLGVVVGVYRKTEHETEARPATGPLPR
jgi:SOS regulatory protein LexA